MQIPTCRYARRVDHKCILRSNRIIINIDMLYKNKNHDHLYTRLWAGIVFIITTKGNVHSFLFSYHSCVCFSIVLYSTCTMSWWGEKSQEHVDYGKEYRIYWIYLSRQYSSSLGTVWPCNSSIQEIFKWSVYGHWTHLAIDGSWLWLIYPHTEFLHGQGAEENGLHIYSQVDVVGGGGADDHDQEMCES